jgi:hypothetical protein
VTDPRQQEIDCIELMRDRLIKEPHNWRGTVLEESSWYKLLVGELDLTEFTVAFRYLLSYWDKRRLNVGGIMKMETYIRLWNCLSDDAKQQWPDIDIKVHQFVGRPECAIHVLQDIMRGPTDISTYLDQFLRDDVGSTFRWVQGIQRAKVTRQLNKEAA